MNQRFFISFYCFNCTWSNWPDGLKKQVPLALKLRWVEQLFDAVQFIHSRSVLHGDISGNSIFLDDNLNAKLGDFAGSATDNDPPLVCYETSHELPGEDISTRTELFALGSTVYEIMTGLKPYKDLPDHEVSAAFSEGRYPDLEPVSAFKNTIMRCWSQSYATVDEGLQDVKSEGMLNSLAKSQPADESYSRYHQRVTHIPFSCSSQLPVHNVSFPSERVFPDSICRLGEALEITSLTHVSSGRSPARGGVVRARRLTGSAWTRSLTVTVTGTGAASRTTRRTAASGCRAGCCSRCRSRSRAGRRRLAGLRRRPDGARPSAAFCTRPCEKHESRLPCVGGG